MELFELHNFKRMRRAACVISVLPGAAIILGFWGFDIYSYLEWGKFEFLGVLIWTAIYGLPPLLIGLLAWRWPRAGAVLLILMAAGSFLFAWDPSNDLAEPIICLAFGAVFLIGGILHLITSPWGHKLWHKR